MLNLQGSPSEREIPLIGWSAKRISARVEKRKKEGGEAIWACRRYSRDFSNQIFPFVAGALQQFAVLSLPHGLDSCYLTCGIRTYKLFWTLAVVIAVCPSAAFWLRHRWPRRQRNSLVFFCQFSVSGHKDASVSRLLSVSWWKGCIYGLFCKTTKSRRQEVTWTQQQEGVC